MTDQESDKDKLRIEKRPHEQPPDDLPVEEKEAEDVQGGLAPPYVPVGPVQKD